MSKHMLQIREEGEAVEIEVSCLKDGGGGPGGGAVEEEGVSPTLLT